MGWEESEAVRDLDSAELIPGLRRLDAWIADSTAQPRLTTTLAGAFAVAALFIKTVGIHRVAREGGLSQP